MRLRGLTFGAGYIFYLVLKDLEQATSVMTQIGYAGSLGNETLPLAVHNVCSILVPFERIAIRNTIYF
mgnify:CR=1 FL=1